MIRFANFNKKIKVEIKEPYIFKKGNTFHFIQKPKVKFECILMGMSVFLMIVTLLGENPFLSLIYLFLFTSNFLSYKQKMKPWEKFLKQKRKEATKIEAALKEKKDLERVLDEINFRTPLERKKNA